MTRALAHEPNARASIALVAAHGRARRCSRAQELLHSQPVRHICSRGWPRRREARQPMKELHGP
eukprot:11081061-Heterocapsa_arctica.AAC.1